MPAFEKLPAVEYEEVQQQRGYAKSRPQQGQTCYECGKPGHYARDCRFAGRQRQPQPRQQERGMQRERRERATSPVKRTKSVRNRRQRYTQTAGNADQGVVSAKPMLEELRLRVEGGESVDFDKSLEYLIAKWTYELGSISLGPLRCAFAEPYALKPIPGKGKANARGLSVKDGDNEYWFGFTNGTFGFYPKPEIITTFGPKPRSMAIGMVTLDVMRHSKEESELETEQVVSSLMTSAIQVCQDASLVYPCGFMRSAKLSPHECKGDCEVGKKYVAAGSVAAGWTISADEHKYQVLMRSGQGGLWVIPDSDDNGIPRSGGISLDGIGCLERTAAKAFLPSFLKKE